jgi:hypothetical protein
LPEGRMNQDEEHLRLLSLFHYIVGGLMALFACIPILHIVIDILMIVSPTSFGSRGDSPPAFIGWFFAILGGVFVLLGWLTASLVLYSGRCLARNRHYLYSLIVAGLCCFFVPLGTISGVFTIIVLIRPTVKERFQKAGQIA